MAMMLVLVLALALALALALVLVALQIGPQRRPHRHHPPRSTGRPFSPPRQVWTR